MALRRALVVLNGRPPGRKLLRSIFRGADVVVGADGGACTLFAAGLEPHSIIGDFDSLHAECLQRASKVQFIREGDQDTTDVEKALRWLLRHTSARDVVLTGTHSNELDHVLGTLSVCAKFANRMRIRIVEDVCMVYVVAERLELTLPVGTRISLLGLGSAEGVRTNGLKWSLDSESLRLGERDGIHNEAIDTRVEINVRSGCLGVFLTRTKGEPFRW